MHRRRDVHLAPEPVDEMVRRVAERLGDRVEGVAGGRLRHAGDTRLVAGRVPTLAGHGYEPFQSETSTVPYPSCQCADPTWTTIEKRFVVVVCSPATARTPETSS